MTDLVAAELSASVVICAFTEQRWAALERAVASVHAQTYGAVEVVVVIDHCPALFDRACDALPAKVVENAHGQGLGGARNTGVRLATGDVVVFLDDDAYAEPEWLERLLAAYTGPDVVAVGGAVLAAFDEGRPAFLPREFDWVIGCSYRGQPTSRAAVRNVIGANMSVRREVFDQVGGFNEALGRIGDRPVGCEETEFCIRAVSARPGARVVLEPTARVHHQVPASRGSWSYFRSRCWHEGLSKAAVARLAGTGPGLAAERQYVTRTLPGGALRGMGEAVRGEAGGAARAAAILAGLTLTTAGYLAGTARLRGSALPQTAAPAVRTDRAATPGAARLTDDITVVIPVRNAEALLPACLESVLACRPAAVVVVDGMSTDGTLEDLAAYPVEVLSDGGRGLPAARLLGAEAARTSLVALIDVDVVLRGENALEELAQEFVDGGYTGLQAGQESVAGPGYWGQALVHHHRTGLSRGWFGLVCTLFERDALLEHGFDARFLSGEDIELRWRLRAAGKRAGVSTRTVVDHRYAGDDFAFARDQFLMDGHGLGLMVRKNGGLRGAALVAVPALAAVRGTALAVLQGKPRYVRYYLAFAVYNYLGMARRR